MTAAVDVLLPTKGRLHTLGPAIESVLRQTHSDFVLHVIGDGCDERTELLVSGIPDRRIRYSRFPKAMGFGYANRNTVLRRTASPYVAYMTDDDLLFPDHLERGIGRLERDGLDMVAFAAARVRPPGRLDPCFFAFDWKLGAFSDFLRNYFIGSANLVHRRSCFDAAGYWDGTLFRFGDREFYNRIRRSSLPSAFDPTITLLRFFALDWDGRYGDFSDAPQGVFLPLLGDPAWVSDLRGRAAAGPRSAGERFGQVRDFARFAARSGPKFLRYVLHRPPSVSTLTSGISAK